MELRLVCNTSIPGLSPQLMCHHIHTVQWKWTYLKVATATRPEQVIQDNQNQSGPIICRLFFFCCCWFALSVNTSFSLCSCTIPIKKRKEKKKHSKCVMRLPCPAGNIEALQKTTQTPRRLHKCCTKEKYCAVCHNHHNLIPYNFFFLPK